MKLTDLEKRVKTEKKIHIIHKVQSVTRFTRKLFGIPEPHDRFTPYDQLSFEERRTRVERIQKQRRKK